MFEHAQQTSFHAVMVHRNGRSSRLILTLLFGDAGDGCRALPIMKCVTEWYVCCFHAFLFPSASVCFWVLLLHTSRAVPNLFFFAVDSASFSIRYSVFTFSNYIQFCSFKLFKLTVFRFFHLYTMLLALHACRKQIHMSIAHFLYHVQFDHRSNSIISNVRILFIQHHDGSSSGNSLHCSERFDNARTSECCASFACVLNGSLFSRKSFDSFTIRCRKLLWWCFARSNLTRGNSPSGITCPVTLTSTHLSFTSVNFL